MLQPIKKWFNPKIWVNWWKPPPFPDWWFAISKNAGRPWSYIFKSPILAHTIGMAVPFGIALAIPGCSLWGAWAVGVAIVFKGQLQKADALISEDWSKTPGYDIRNIICRSLIAAVPWGVICLLV